MDSDKITISKKKQPTDFMSLFGGLLSKINFKIIILLFIVYILIHNDIFIGQILSKIKGTVGELGTCPTTKGTIILGIIYILIYIIIDVLNKNDVI